MNSYCCLMGAHIRIRVTIVLKEFAFDLGRQAQVEMTFVADPDWCQ